MVRSLLGVVALLLTVTPLTALADEPPRPGDQPPHAGSGASRRGEGEPPAPAPPAPAPVPAPAPATPPPGYVPPAPVLQRPSLAQRDGGGFGAGMWFLTVEHSDETDWETLELPALTLTYRKVRPYSHRLGMETMGMIVIQDFETIGDWYQWYGEESEEDTNGDGKPEDYRVLKWFFLWPGLLIGPFAGANMHSGAGVTGYLADDYPAPYISGGIQFGFYLRPSEDDFIFDFTAGFYSAFGIDFSKTMGIDLRGFWGPPIFHATNDRPETNNYTISLNLMLYRAK